MSIKSTIGAKMPRFYAKINNRAGLFVLRHEELDNSANFAKRCLEKSPDEPLEFGLKGYILLPGSPIALRD